MNLLRRANDELGARFDLSSFKHEALYDSHEGRIEMRLVSLRDQRVPMAGELIDFGRGEPITTEYSYKYRLDHLQELFSRGGWNPVRTWTDKKNWFSVNCLTLDAA